MPKKPTDDDDSLLTLPELAHYLHLDEKTVFKLVQSGKIPGVNLDRQWRFKRSAIDEWIEQQLVGDDESFADIPDGMKVPLEDLLPDSAIIINLKAGDSLSVIEELAGRAWSNNWLHDKPWFVGAVVERETLASTAMDGGVAFLHTRAKDKGKIVRPFIICGRSWEGISFGAPDGRPTYLFFLLGLKYDRLHLPILGRLARALRNPATIARLRSLSSTEQIRAVLLKEDAAARAGTLQVFEPQEYKPKLDRQMRLRAIRRLESIRKTDDEIKNEPPKKAKKAAKPKPTFSRAGTSPPSAPSAPPKVKARGPVTPHAGAVPAPTVRKAKPAAKK